MDLEKYFGKYRKGIVGVDQQFMTPFGEKTMVYADWIASGRLYEPIERCLLHSLGPFTGNTHSETSETGILMTRAYQRAHELIKQHCHAGSRDIIITAGSGMTTVINKFQRILGLKYCGKVFHRRCLQERERPVVFITHMEHHSNQTSWYETNADVVIIEPGPNLEINPDNLKRELEKYRERPFKIGSFTACSNVTGVHTPYHRMAALMHRYGGICFIDFAASAPYEEINMHPPDPMEKLDAIFFSPHKFLGGPGSSGVLIFDSSIYNNEVPDQPGGGTVDWTNPWGEYKYVDDIELREDGGTPGFLQAVRAALCLRLKEEMGTDLISQREKELVEMAFAGLDSIPGLRILANNIRNRLGIISFYIEDIHYNLVVRLLNDLYGIQVRGGCACAGTYGHLLLEVSHEKSQEITWKITHGDLSEKPGWIRWSLHPTTTGAEVKLMLDALSDIARNKGLYKSYYLYNPHTNCFRHREETPEYHRQMVEGWFDLKGEINAE